MDIFPVCNTNIYKICELRRAIFSTFYNISQPNFAVLLILRCSFQLWCLFGDHRSGGDNCWAYIVLLLAQQIRLLKKSFLPLQKRNGKPFCFVQKLNWRRLLRLEQPNQIAQKAPFGLQVYANEKHSSCKQLRNSNQRIPTIKIS